MTADLESALERLDAAGLRRKLRAIERIDGRVLRMDGADAVDFASNDYLGLAADARISAAVRAELDSSPFGGGAARLIAGNHPRHSELERELALYKHTEAALLFSSGYLANVGCIPALAGRNDVIFADELNHASLVDGCRLSRADVSVFRHCDLDHLRKLLAQPTAARRRLIVVDGVFSMDGDLFPLDELVAIADEHDAWTYVDDAHGTGVLGETGRGSAELFGVEGEIDVLMGTLGKALGTSGAFVCGSRTLIDFLTNRARSFVFTTAAPPAMSAGAIEAVRIAATDSTAREKLWDNCDYFQRAAAKSSLAARVRADKRAGHIVPIVIGESDRTMEIGQALLSRGFLVGAVRPPTVPLGSSRLRITLSAAHTHADIDAVIHELSALMELNG
jgi:8-amino-7-oxononanoate synthase